MQIAKFKCLPLDDLPPELGQAIRPPTGKATFQNDILSYWDAFAGWEISGRAGIGWFELNRRPFNGSEAERHRLTPEALLCFQGSAICLVGRPKEPQALAAEDFQAFFVEAGQGIVFAPGVWHALPFPVSEKAVFWVVFRQGTAQEDLEVLDLDKQRGFRFEITL